MASSPSVGRGGLGGMNRLLTKRFVNVNEIFRQVCSDTSVCQDMAAVRHAVCRNFYVASGRFTWRSAFLFGPATVLPSRYARRPAAFGSQWHAGPGVRGKPR